MNWRRQLANDNIDILDVITNHGIEYKETKEDYHIVCPFHPDVNPSCSVSMSKGVFYCYGCQKRGDLVFLVAKIEKVKIDAIIDKYAKMDSSKFPSSLEEVNNKKDRSKSEEETLLELYEYKYKECCNIFHQIPSLLKGPFSEEMKFYYFVETYVEYYYYCILELENQVKQQRRKKCEKLSWQQLSQ